jgi:hypothetical protein
LDVSTRREEKQKPSSAMVGVFTKRHLTMSINIDGKDYPLESLSDQAKAELQMVQFTDQEIARLTALLAMAQTARNAYANALQAALPKDIQ